MKSIFSIGLYILVSYPLRVVRTIAHLIPYKWHGYRFKYDGVVAWLGGIIFSLLDLLALPDIYMLIVSVMKYPLQSLNSDQHHLIVQFFGDGVNSNYIRLNTKEKWVTKKYASAFVSGNIVNFDKQISDATLIHEIVHICQYQKFGSPYIFLAWKAHLLEDPYDYDGYFGLAKSMNLGFDYLDFNIEQQAQIIEDYYEIRNRSDLMMNTTLVKVYEHYYRQMLDVYLKS